MAAVAVTRCENLNASTFSNHQWWETNVRSFCYTPCKHCYCSAKLKSHAYALSKRNECVLQNDRLDLSRKTAALVQLDFISKSPRFVVLSIWCDASFSIRLDWIIRSNVNCAASQGTRMKASNNMKQWHPTIDGDKHVSLRRLTGIHTQFRICIEDASTSKILSACDEPCSHHPATSSRQCWKCIFVLWQSCCIQN